MHLFIVGDFFRRRRRRRPARDPLPTDPLIRVMLFWALFGIGALLGGVALVVREAVLIALFATGALACLYGSIVLFRRLNRE